MIDQGMTKTATAMDTLIPLIAQARAEKKWLRCAIDNTWFSPDELEAANREGRFRWGAVNWTLRDPEELLQEAAQEILRASDNFCNIRKRMERSQA